MMIEVLALLIAIAAAIAAIVAVRIADDGNDRIDIMKRSLSECSDSYYRHMEDIVRLRYQVYEVKRTARPSQCPRCGAYPRLASGEAVTFSGNDAYKVICPICGLSGEQAISPREAYAEWEKAVRKAIKKGEDDEI